MPLPQPKASQLDSTRVEFLGLIMVKLMTHKRLANLSPSMLVKIFSGPLIARGSLLAALIIHSHINWPTLRTLTSSTLSLTLVHQKFWSPSSIIKALSRSTWKKSVLKFLRISISLRVAPTMIVAQIFLTCTTWLKVTGLKFQAPLFRVESEMKNIRAHSRSSPSMPLSTFLELKLTTATTSNMTSKTTRWHSLHTVSQLSVVLWKLNNPKIIWESRWLLRTEKMVKPGFGLSQSSVGWLFLP